MEELKKVLEEAISEIKPQEEERYEALRIFEEVKRLVEGSLHIPYDFTVELHGSVAKGTELRGMIDLDVFLLIRYDDISKEWLESEVIRPLFDIFKDLYKGVKLKYATHPYIYISLGKYEIDIVPAYWAKDISEIKTAVDRTPFHTKYVLSRLTEDMKDEVRLLKAFFRSVGVYGAEIKVEGFSGYLTELLAIKYRNFLNAIANIAGWRFGEVVVIDEDSTKINRSCLKKVFKAPLIVLDPVDPKRNAASAVSAESLARVVLASSIFLQKPSKELIVSGVRAPELDSVKNMCHTITNSGREAIGVLFKLASEVVPDVLWGKLRSVTKSLIGFLQRAGFAVVSYSIWSDELSEAFLVITLLPKELPPYEVHPGPPLGKVTDIKSFTLKYFLSDKNLGPYVSPSGRIFTLRRRKYTRPHQVVEEYLNSVKIGEGISTLGVLRNASEVCEYVELRKTPELLLTFRKAAKLELF
ncbi:MAG: CCA tRNA nucleotidyltransferase [Sulfolobales archaeon]